jgi:hypothetical protein
VAGQYRATAALQTDEDILEEVKQWLRLQDKSSYYKGFDRLIYRCDKCLNRYGDCVEKQTAYVPIVPISDTRVTDCSLFMFQASNMKTYFVTSSRNI